MNISLDFFTLKEATLVLLNVFLIAGVGYLIGSIKIKGVTLGTAAVFIVALLVGHLSTAMPGTIFAIEMPGFVQNIGLVLFVTAVGFIAGPNFFRNLKQNAKSYVLLGLVVIISGALACILVVLCTSVDSSLAVGMLSGALTTTPGFAAAKEAVAASEELVNEVSVGHGVAYPFGVVGIVLFVQLIPRLLKANMDEERAKLVVVSEKKKKEYTGKLFAFDEFGFMSFSMAVILGILLGAVTIPLPGGASFSLGNTGGPLIMALIFGHFSRIGKFDLRVRKNVLEVFREFGLMMFLIGAGVEGGAGFVEIIQEYGFMLFVYGAFMTLVPMIVGFLFAKYVLKLSLLNNLGSLTGGMTSTPALGTLISVSGTDDVASAYASTYPIALIVVVFACQFIVLFF